MNSLIFYNGPSVLTGKPVLGILTGLTRPSANAKTGPMVQAWVLLRDVSHIEAVNTGQDTAICGTCPLRSGSNIGRACYVIWWLAPQKIWRARHTYQQIAPNLAASHLVGQSVRVTAYGDAAAIPFDAWAMLLARAKHHVGYTHQWQRCDPRFKLLLMASVDTVRDQAVAAAQGWRTYRDGWELADPKIEVQCPASEEAGHRTTCINCTLCQGTSLTAKSVAIQPHGQRTRWMPA